MFISLVHSRSFSVEHIYISVCDVINVEFLLFDRFNKKKEEKLPPSIYNGNKRRIGLCIFNFSSFEK